MLDLMINLTETGAFLLETWGLYSTAIVHDIFHLEEWVDWRGYHRTSPVDTLPWLCPRRHGTSQPVPATLSRRLTHINHTRFTVHGRRDVTRPWAHKCRALLPPHSSPFCQDERPLPSSLANRQFLKNLLCPLPFSLLSFCKARWETSCGHSWQTISDIALSQKPAAGQYRHIPLSYKHLSHWLPYCSNLLWTINNHHITPHVHWPPYHRNLFWAIKNTPCRSIYSTIDHPIAATCSGQSITKIPSPSTPFVTTLLQESAPGNYHSLYISLSWVTGELSPCSSIGPGSSSLQPSL